MKKVLIMASCFLLLNTKQADAQNIYTVAGNGTAGYTTGSTATTSDLHNPCAIAFDAAGNLYIADQTNNRIRKVSVATGAITLYAGNGTAGPTGDGGQASLAELNSPTGITFDAAGNLYIADQYNYRIRKVTPAGIISTVAGTGVAGFSGDGGPAVSAQLDNPCATAFDAAGNMYIADYTNNRIRKVTPAGVISTFAGTGIQAYSGDGGQAINAELNGPVGIGFDAAGDLYIADRYNNRIRMVNPTGVISTFAGNGTGGFSGDGTATAVELNAPFGLSIDASNNVYIADLGNNRVRKVTAAGILSTLAGTGTAGYNGDGIPAISAELSSPPGVALDLAGNLCIADWGNNRVRIIGLSASSATICVGGSTKITASGASTYTWSTGLTTPSIAVNPTITTTYSVSSNLGFGLTATATGTVTVNPLPTVTVNSATICVGNTATLTAGGGATYTWNTSATTASISATPTVTTDYTVTATSAQGCKGTATATITVDALPTVTVNSATVCAGTSTILTAGGANTYSWNTGATTNSITATPTVTTDYTVTGTNAQGCKGTAVAVVTVRPGPIVTVNSVTLCAGTSGTLTANGAASYTWSTGSHATSISGTPTVSATYTVTGSNDFGCTSSAVAVVTVNPLPVITASSETICAGGTYTLCSGNSAPSTSSWYTMVNGVKSATSFSTSPCVVVTPTANTSYNVVVTNTNGCSANETITLTTISNNPAFVLTETPSGAYFTFEALANMVPSTVPAGYGDQYVVQELLSPTGPVKWSSPAPEACYWENYPYPTYFNGINNSVTDYAGPGITLPACATATGFTAFHPCPSVIAEGEFRGNTTYVISHTSWNSVCPVSAPYSYTVTVQSPAGRMGEHIIVRNNEVTANDATGINNATTENVLAQAAVYPNPSNGNFTIETTTTAQQLVEVYDLAGRLVFSQTITGTTAINANELPAGMYNLKVSGADKAVNKRIVIAR